MSSRQCVAVAVPPCRTNPHSDVISDRSDSEVVNGRNAILNDLSEKVQIEEQGAEKREKYR